MRVAVVQTSPTTDVDHNLETIERLTRTAAEAGATLVIFPEEAGLLAEDDLKPRFSEVLPEVWPRFEAEMKRLARETGVTLIAACYEPSGSHLAYNTILGVSPEGEEIARYRKVHLYDAFSYQESQYILHGTQLPPVVGVDGYRIGIANCYDVRFPELFRSMADQGVDIIALSAAWVSGKSKEEHWTLLTQARALENVAWMLAAGTVGDDTVGLSRIIDPLGTVVASADARHESIIYADIDRESIDSARRTLPALENRRIVATLSVKEN